jgi:hypothetical protein
LFGQFSLRCAGSFAALGGANCVEKNEMKSAFRPICAMQSRSQWFSDRHTTWSAFWRVWAPRSEH